MARGSKPLSGVRLGVQVAALVLTHGYLTSLTTRRLYSGGTKSTCLPVLGCHTCPTATFSCPIGTAQHYATLHQVPFFLIGQLGLVGLLVGGMACGWLCPFGLLQDLLYRLRTVKVPIPRSLSVARYPVLLLLVVLIPLATHESWFSKLCPAGTLTAALPWLALDPHDPVTGQALIPSGSVGALFGIKVLILVGVLGLMVITSRPFCRVLCPLGLILSLFNRVSVLQLSVDHARCDRCDRCLAVCPVDIAVYEEPCASDCIRCLKCTACPHVAVTVRSLTGPTEARCSDARVRSKNEAA